MRASCAVFQKPRSGSVTSFVEVMAYGSVQRIPVDVNPDTLRAFFTSDAIDVVGPF